MPKIGKQEKALRDTGAIRAIEDEVPNEEVLMLNGAKYTRRELVALFREHLAALDEVHDLTIRRSVAVQRERKLEKRVRVVAYYIGKMLKGRMGADNPRLGKYAVQPEKKPEWSAEVKARAVERRRETRKRRGTMGRKQRARLKAKQKRGG